MKRQILSYSQVVYGVHHDTMQPLHFYLEADVPVQTQIALYMIDPAAKKGSELITPGDGEGNSYWAILPDIGVDDGLDKFDEEGELILHRMYFNAAVLFERIGREFRWINPQLKLFDPETMQPLYTQQGGIFVFLPNGVKPPGIE